MRRRRRQRPEGRGPAPGPCRPDPLRARGVDARRKLRRSLEQQVFSSVVASPFSLSLSASLSSSSVSLAQGSWCAQVPSSCFWGPTHPHQKRWCGAPAEFSRRPPHSGGSHALAASQPARRLFPLHREGGSGLGQRGCRARSSRLAAQKTARRRVPLELKERSASSSTSCCC